MTDQSFSEIDAFNCAARADWREAEAHGQAAMLLVESLIHGLIARQVLTVEDAVEIVSEAIEVKQETAADRRDSDSGMQHSLFILGAIGASLESDLRAI